MSQGSSKLVIDEMRKLVNLSSKCFIYKIYLQLHSLHPFQCLTYLTSLSLTKRENKRPRSHTHICSGVLHRKCFNTYILDRICYNRLIIFSRIFSVFGNVFSRFFPSSIETKIYVEYAWQPIRSDVVFYLCYNTIYINLSVYIMISQSSHS